MLQGHCHVTRSLSCYKVTVMLQGHCHVTGSLSCYRVTVMLQGQCDVTGSLSCYRVTVMLPGHSDFTGSPLFRVIIFFTFIKYEARKNTSPVSMAYYIFICIV